MEVCTDFPHGAGSNGDLEEESADFRDFLRSSPAATSASYITKWYLKLGCLGI